MLLIDRFQNKTSVLGPGIRSVVWFHGCSRKCKGCIAAEMNNSNDFYKIEVQELLENVRSVNGVEGITLSGGEPFQQDLSEMYSFLSQIKQTTSLSVMVYTGYLLSEIMEDGEKKKLLDFIDVLVDGPYIEEEDKGQLWRGSENQSIYFLSARYKDMEAQIKLKTGRPVEFAFTEGLQFSITGIPPRGFKDSLSRRLKEKDLNITW